VAYQDQDHLSALALQALVAPPPFFDGPLHTCAFVFAEKSPSTQRHQDTKARTEMMNDE
jgi:hypothetical protein